MGKVKKATNKGMEKQKPLRGDYQNDKKTRNQPLSNRPALSLPAKITTYTTPPSDWPSSMPYLAAVLPSQSLSSSQHLLIQPNSLPTNQPNATTYSINSPVTFSPTANPLVQIRSITDPKHPAYPQNGLFANKALSPGSHIVDYTGVIHSCPQPSCAASDYDLAFLDRDASLAIDSASMGNEGRFVNDYHGIRDEGPNAVFEEYYVLVKNNKGGKVAWQARMGIWVAPNKAGRGIGKGEEICVSYGKGWWRARRSLMEADHQGEDENEEDVSQVHVDEANSHTEPSVDRLQDLHIGTKI